jgi:hypothetical protein
MKKTFIPVAAALLFAPAMAAEKKATPGEYASQLHQESDARKAKKIFEELSSGMASAKALKAADFPVGAIKKVQTVIYGNTEKNRYATVSGDERYFPEKIKIRFNTRSETIDGKIVTFPFITLPDNSAVAGESIDGKIVFRNFVIGQAMRMTEAVIFKPSPESETFVMQAEGGDWNIKGTFFFIMN